MHSATVITAAGIEAETVSAPEEERWNGEDRPAGKRGQDSNASYLTAQPSSAAGSQPNDFCPFDPIETKCSLLLRNTQLD